MKNRAMTAPLRAHDFKVVGGRQHGRQPLSATMATAMASGGSHHWHADMQQIGLRLVGERMGSPASHSNFQDMRVPAPQRVLWERVRQAYAVLRGKAYARPLRGPW